MTINRNTNRIVFQAGALTLWSRLIEGTYFDYTQVVPSTWDRDIIVSRDELLAILAQFIVARASKDEPTTIRLDVANGVMTVHYRTADRSAQSTLPASAVVTTPYSIYFGAIQLRDVLRMIPTPRIALRCNSPKQVVKFVGMNTGSDLVDETCYHLLMPFSIDTNKTTYWRAA